MIYSPGASQDARHDMNPLSAADVFLTVAIMSVAFLTEIALFILIGMIWKNRALWAARSPCEGLVLRELDGRPAIFRHDL
jgi:hypothetical protein